LVLLLDWTLETKLAEMILKLLLFISKRKRLALAVISFIFCLLNYSPKLHHHGGRARQRNETSNATSTIFDLCNSASSLSSILASKQYFSRYNPLCPFSPTNHIHIAIPFYNLDEKTLKESIKSVKEQWYPKDKMTIWVYDDASDRSNSRLVLYNSCGANNVYQLASDFPIPNQDDVIPELNVDDVSGEIFCFRASRHLGAAGSKYFLFQIVKNFAKPNEVIMVVDGDDKLMGHESLRHVNQKYIDTSCWFTYGSYEGKWSEQIVDLPPSVRDGTQKFEPRQQTWLYGHPRTFKVHLLDYITADDFKFLDGAWLSKGTDRGFVYRMLELSGPDRIGYISNRIYKYQYSDQFSTLAQVSKEMRDAQIKHTMEMERSHRLNLDVHVVLLVWKRVHLLRHQLDWLQQQIGLNNRRIHLHIVNNNAEINDVVNSIVKIFIQSPPEVSGAALPLVVSTKNNQKQNFHNFERFIHVAQLRDEFPLDHVIFLDDDQYWPKDFLSKLLRGHKPKGMTTWYGKTFERVSSGYANYWKSTITMIDIVNGEKWPDVAIFKYGGTGGSIFDTNLWLLESQLLRLREDLSGWAKIDDLWASYVIDALLGWELRRLAPPDMPIDIGRYHDSEEYNRTITKHLSYPVQRELMKLQPQSGHSIRTSATFLDPSVDKQKMFVSLQTKFMWDIHIKN